MVCDKSDLWKDWFEGSVLVQSLQVILSSVMIMMIDSNED